MSQIDLSNCLEVARLELAYLHDIQINLQEMNKALWGEMYFENKIRPRLVFDREAPDDYLESLI